MYFTYSAKAAGMSWPPEGFCPRKGSSLPRGGSYGFQSTTAKLAYIYFHLLFIVDAYHPA